MYLGIILGSVSHLTHGVAGGHVGNSNVAVEGSWDNWTTRQPLQRTGADFSIVRLLPPGVYQV